MAITKKPDRKLVPPQPQEEAAATAFIESAGHPPPAAPAVTPEAPSPEASTAPEAPSAEARPEKLDKDKDRDKTKVKMKGNGKDKVKDKGKDKDKDKKKKKGKANKEAVLIRFEDDHLDQVDARAAAIGLSRAAWVRMVVAQALAKDGPSGSGEVTG